MLSLGLHAQANCQPCRPIKLVLCTKRMTKLLILYGAEASGKLTIAREIASLTNLKLFHNHVSIDVGRVLFDYGDERFNDLVWKVRLAVLESAAKNNLPGVIFTWAYSHPEFQPLLDNLLATVSPYGVEVLYVYVKCSQNELERRVTNDDRKEAGKAHTVEILHKQQRAKNHVVIPNTDSFIVDSTDLPPHEVARMIVSEFRLCEVGT